MREWDKIGKGKAGSGGGRRERKGGWGGGRGRGGEVGEEGVGRRERNNYQGTMPT